MSAHPFEVAHVGENKIRISPIHGGNQRHIKFDVLNKLIEQNQIEVTYTPPSSNSRMLSGLSESQLVKLNRKVTYVKAVCREHEHARSQAKIAATIKEVAAKINDLKPPSTSTVAGWAKQWIEAKFDRTVFMPKLKPSRSEFSKLNPELVSILRKAVSDTYLTRQKNPQSAVMAEVQVLIAEYNATHDSQMTVPSKEKLRKFINNMDSYEIAVQRHGKAYANRHFRAAGMSFIAKEPLDMVMADGQVMDVILVREDENGVRDDIGRPYLTSFIDVRTRVILAFFISLAPFCGATLLRTLKEAVVEQPDKPKGIPSKIIIDNGADYQDSGFLKACNKLNILVEACIPRDPNAKALIERFFKTLNTDLIHKFPGTTFSNPEDRGDYDSQEIARLTIDELNDFVENWIEDIYHIRPHRSLERAPIDVWNEEIASCYPNTLQDKDGEILLRDEVERTLSKGRVEAHGLFWKCPALTSWEQAKRRLNQDRKVIIRIDELNLSTVYVATVDEPNQFHKAYPCKPSYMHDLSLYEHKLLREQLKAKRIQERMNRLDDTLLYQYRLEFHAALGHKDDRVAKRKLARLKQLKASRTNQRMTEANNSDNSSLTNKVNKATQISTSISRTSKPARQFESTQISKRNA
jgi:putative transposase